MNEQKTDTRRYARFEMFEYAMIYLPSQPDPIRTVVVDIGLGGLQLRSRGPLPVGETCVISLGGTQPSGYELRGEVRYSSQLPDSDIFASGVRFLPGSHEDRVTIAEYVHSVFQNQAELMSHQPPLDL